MAIPINLPKKANIKGFWKLDGNGNDVLYSNDLIVTGGGYAACKINNGYQGDGTGTYLTTTNAIALGTVGTICLWFKPDVNVGADNHPADYRYFNRTVDNTNLYWRIIKDGIGDAGKTLFYVPGTGSILVDLQYVAGTLYHMAVTWNGASGTVMYRGATSVANSGTTTTDVGSTKLRFGWNAEAGMLDGIFDEIIYWNVALTQPEVEQVKNITAYKYGGAFLLNFI